MKRKLLGLITTIGLFLTSTAQNTVVLKVDLGSNEPSAEGVFVAGSIQSAASGGAVNDWTPGDPAFQLTQEGSSTVYAITLDLPDGNYNYKFLNGPGGWEGNIGAPCGTGSHRILTVAGAAVTEQYCYNSCDANCPLGTFTITFNVDMRFNCSFDVNSTDSVAILGSFNGYTFNPTALMTDADNDGIYTLVLENVAAGSHSFKARRIYSGQGGGDGWEDGADRQIMLESDLVLPARCFGFMEPGECAPIPAPANVTFMVDMNNEIPAPTINFKGGFTSPAWNDGARQMTPVEGMPGVFETTFEDVCPGVLRWKFVNGGNLNADEELYPSIGGDTTCLARNPFNNWERIFVRTSAEPVTLGFVYNSCEEIEQTNTIEVENTISNLFPNPADNMITVEFANDAAIYTVEMFDILGKQVLVEGGVRGSYRIHKGNLVEGMYLVRVTNQKGVSSTQKVFFN